jgi:hypothetical protein
MNLEAIVYSLVGGVVGSGVTVIGSLINTAMARKSEEKKQIRELSAKIALEHWKAAWERQPKEQWFDPNSISIYMVHAMQLVSTMDGSLKTTEEITEHLKKSFSTLDAANEAVLLERRGKQKVTGAIIADVMQNLLKTK